MTRLEPVAFALSLTLTFLLLYIACTAAVAAFPGSTVNFFNAWFHGLDLNLLRPPGGRPMTLSQLVIGALAVIVVAFPGGLVLAGLYNVFATRIGTFATSQRP